MKKIIITCRAHPGEPEWFALWQLARGTFEKYAVKHGYDYKDFWFDDFDEAEWPGIDPREDCRCGRSTPP